MATVIIGGGIIGCSTAYYLSDLSSPTKNHEIHIIDSSPTMFDCASGYAAGFIARDWFADGLMSLGELSFDLHRELAQRYNGREKWGYMSSTAWSLDVRNPRRVRRVGGGDGWARDGESRAEISNLGEDLNTGSTWGPPRWLAKQKGGELEMISEDGTAAQVDPFHFSQFLLDTNLNRGVKLHHPATPISYTTDPSSGTITGIRIKNLQSRDESTIPCSKLVLAAGAWTPRVFKTLFPSSPVHILVSSLSGYSLLFRSPRYTESDERDGRGNTVFSTHPRASGFSPEICSRKGGHIYIAGLNGLDTSLPETVTGVKDMIEPGQFKRLRDVSVTLMGKRPSINDHDPEADEGTSDESPNIDDLEIVRESLCFRPLSDHGLPIVSKVEDQSLGPDVKTTGGVFVATGHGPWGISLAPGTGKVVAEMVDGVETTADVSGLGLKGSRRGRF